MSIEKYILDMTLHCVHARRQVHHIIEGVIEGETRVFSAGLTIKDMFEDREKFRKTVQDKVQKVGIASYMCCIAHTIYLGALALVLLAMLSRVCLASVQHCCTPLHQ